MRFIFILIISIFFSGIVCAQTSFCPGCLGPAPCGSSAVGSVSIICVSPGVGAAGETEAYILIFEDEFNGGTLDLSKWLTPQETGSHNPAQKKQPISYDSGVNNMKFNYPGMAIVDSNVPAFYAKAVSYGADADTEPDRIPNYRPWHYTTANLQSMYNFPSHSRNLPDSIPGFGTIPPFYLPPNFFYGIYALECTLPTNSPKNPYEITSNGTSSIWPAFWMIGINPGDYGEIDGFEFNQASTEDFQTAHAPVVNPACQSIVDPGSTDFGNGANHTHTIIYTPYEIDWWVDNTITREDAKYYYSYDTFIESPFYPYVCNNLPPTTPDYLAINDTFPDTPMQLQVGNGVQDSADPSVFPVSLNIQAVKYYQLLPCTGTRNVNTTMIYNVDTDNTASHNTFNIFTGETVNLNGPIFVPRYKDYLKPGSYPYYGQLEAIASKTIVFTGKDSISGYFVARLNGNLCSEYSGTPLPSTYQPITDEGRIKPKDTTSTKPANKDSLNILAKQSATRGEFSISAISFSPSEINKVAQVTVYSMMGQPVYQGTLVIENTNELNINLSSQPKGIYLIVMRTDDKICQKRIILQ